MGQILRASCEIFCKLFTSTILLLIALNGTSQNQNSYKCNVSSQFISGHKAQYGADKRVIAGDSSMWLYGNLIRLYNKTDSSFRINLIYTFITSRFDEAEQGKLKKSKIFIVGHEAKFSFKNLDGGISNILLPITGNSSEIYIGENNITQICDLDIPPDAIIYFTKKKIFTIEVPFFDGEIKEVVKFPTIFMDYYKCFLKN